MWEQLSAADPPLKHPKDIEIFAKYRDRHRFMHFMMGLREDFEPTRSSLLSQSPTPSLDAAVNELISKENRWPTYHMSSSEHVLATSSPPPLPPITTFTTPPWINSRRSTSQSSKGPSLTSSLTVTDIEAVVQQLSLNFHAIGQLYELGVNILLTNQDVDV
ncbi:hypothetical protein SO802_002558 [Lithocarpus litseifolius]|uniref:Uncharacterized protein n=1 Tax=Lithocarpus litseifolius TaxID=425828 RepID=A0AAW2E1C5_9ROSI